MNTVVTGFSGTGTDTRTSGGTGAMTGSGFYNATTAVDGFVISSGVPTFTNGSVIVYGYTK